MLTSLTSPSALWQNKWGNASFKSQPEIVQSTLVM